MTNYTKTSSSCPDGAIIIPLANEAEQLPVLFVALQTALDQEEKAIEVFFVIDRASRDKTLTLARSLCQQDARFTVLWCPQNRHLADAYRAGLRAAYERGAGWMIEMDGGGSHQASQLKDFVQALTQYDCAWGSRFVAGGQMKGSLFRRMVSRGSTFLANLLLGTRLHDMTSGFQGLTRQAVEQWLAYAPLASFHFYQTEMRYVLRYRSHCEIPISYHPTGGGISWASWRNAGRGLLILVARRWFRELPKRRSFRDRVRSSGRWFVRRVR